MVSILKRARPETAAGGFTRNEGAIQFFTRVASLIDQNSDVLDFGAGRGLFQEDALPFRRNLRTLKGRVRKITGVDVDPIVLTNSGVDDTFVVLPGETLPFSANSFDLVISEWVLEHLEDPGHFAAEMQRVMRPGGWLCARTPNKWGLTALGARMVPNSWHGRALVTLNPGRQEKDVFPTRYRINTMRDLRHYFPEARWQHASYYWRGEPKYYGRSMILFRLMELWNWAVPPFMATDLFVFVRKK